MTAGHEHGWGDDFPACTPIADDVCLVREEDSDGNLTGYWISHEWEAGQPRCLGRVIVVPREGLPQWAQTGTLDGGDLTLTPSILCPEGPPGHVPFHGYVTAGRWVPC